MAGVGVASARTLEDVANAIRSKNGESRRYAPGEMADAVAALDGTQPGGGAQYPYGETAFGLMDGGCYAAIADAIRRQNGETRGYRPSEMAQAIRDLAWESKKQVYAVAVPSTNETGRYTLNFIESETRPVEGEKWGTWSIAKVYEDFEEAVYASNSKVPWWPLHDKFLSVNMYATVKPKSCAYWFYNFSACTRFDLTKLDTSETASLAYMFFSCTAMTGLSLTGLATPCVTTINYMFYNCTKLTNLVLGAWDMTKVTVWAQAFRNLTAIEQLDFSRCALPSYTSTMYYCFYSCSKLARIYVPAGCDMSDTSLAGYCFGGCRNLVGGAGTAWSSGSVTADMARVDGLGGKPGYFTAK